MLFRSTRAGPEVRGTFSPSGRWRPAVVARLARTLGVTTPMSLSTSISFKTERFDYRSELPGDINAGNRFYGKDVAEFIVEQLKSNGLNAAYLDEDWGWLVFSLKGQTPIFQIAVHNLAEYNGATERGIPEPDQQDGSAARMARSGHGRVVQAARARRVRIVRRLNLRLNRYWTCAR